MSTENGMFIKPGAVASRLGVSQTRVYQMCEQGILPHIRFGRAVRIPTAAFEEWASNQVSKALASVRETTHAETA